MMSEQKMKQQRLMTVTMENLVPEDHFLRKLDAVVDMDFIYELVRPLYSQHGRPSIVPVTLVRACSLDICMELIRNESSKKRYK